MKRKLFAMGAGKALLIVAVMMNCSLAIYSGVGIVSQKNEGLEDPTNKGKAADKFSVDSFDNKLLGKDIAPPSKCSFKQFKVDSNFIWAKLYHDEPGNPFSVVLPVAGTKRLINLRWSRTAQGKVDNAAVYPLRATGKLSVSGGEGEGEQKLYWRVALNVPKLRVYQLKVTGEDGKAFNVCDDSTGKEYCKLGDVFYQDGQLDGVLDSTEDGDLRYPVCFSKGSKMKLMPFFKVVKGSAAIPKNVSVKIRGKSPVGDIKELDGGVGALRWSDLQG